ncbi:glycoside hydrolase family 9 protein [Acidipila sp. EB88]|uniref:glycoside hydrolase family 9 protein n=1 Tax=Acidipila sp. EB88 TaxID=2305226 RepID=UPI001F3718C6|nr:glycoside hydrolase family 9 protein [Acidipila sp. EB88]
MLVDQLGYDVDATKIALLEGSSADATHLTASAGFEIVDVASSKTIFTGVSVPASKVFDWGDRVFWKLDFSGLTTPGHYRLILRSRGKVVSTCEFAIDRNLLERSTLSNVLFYFKGQRATGAFDRADSHLKNPEGAGFVDVRGGWYDATGDYGIHFSHQNPTSYFNPQQVPLVAWSLLSSYRLLEGRNDDDLSEYERRLLDEGLFGADFITRMKRPQGSFFESISAPGAHKLAADREIGNPNWRTQIKTNAGASTTSIGAAEGPYAYETSFRSGGGVAIAALALASTMPEHGEFSGLQYLEAAETAFSFLQAHNKEVLNDGHENILDDYCALLAATELFKATGKQEYRTAADDRAARLMSRLTIHGQFSNYWRADDTQRPFFHPADAGMPVVTLLRYAAEVASPPQKTKVLEAVRKSLDFELRLTDAVNNPFGYARQLVSMKDKTVRAAFFFPHDTEAAPWWQGENARLASMASAARLAAPFYQDDPKFQRQLEVYAWNQLHWILGRNPFDSSMLIGSGERNAPYMFFRSYKYTSAPGAIINGVTAASDNEDGIAFNEGFAVTGKDEDWRWTEEWLPHAAWYLYAVSLPHSASGK